MIRVEYLFGTFHHPKLHRHTTGFSLRARRIDNDVEPFRGIPKPLERARHRRIRNRYFVDPWAGITVHHAIEIDTENRLFPHRFSLRHDQASSKDRANLRRKLAIARVCSHIRSLRFMSSRSPSMRMISSAVVFNILGSSLIIYHTASGLGIFMRIALSVTIRQSTPFCVSVRSHPSDGRMTIQSPTLTFWPWNCTCSSSTKAIGPFLSTSPTLP